MFEMLHLAMMHAVSRLRKLRADLRIISPGRSSADSMQRNFRIRYVPWFQFKFIKTY